ncbi:MAG: peptidoglycan-binding domain-containing protein [Chloroflexota bacterium]
MTRVSLIIPICITFASGCALFSGAEMEGDKPPVSTPVIENVTASVEPATRAPARVDALAPPPRTLSQDDIRRLQMRLREIGLDPGPVDGVAGPRTKNAFRRLLGGCARVAPLADKFSAGSTQIASGGSATVELPSRAETLALQTQLRSAGFNPGPADGIFGSRTKAAVAQLHAGCLFAKEFDGLSDESLRTAGNVAPVTKPTGIASVRLESQSIESPKRPLASSSPAPHEEIRILQLRLRDAGFDPGPFDGVMGPKTKLALAQYEASQSGKKIKTSLITKSISGQY